MLDRLREHTAKTFARLRGKPVDVPPSTDASFYAPLDPTIGFGGGDDSEEYAGSLPLSAQLEDSARAIRRRADRLHADANRLVARIGERAEAEVTLATQAARVLIGLVWLGVAAWLYNGALSAKGAGAELLANGMPVDDAFVLSRTFLIIAAAGLGVAMAVAALVSGFGKAGNEAVRREAENLGFKIAETSQDFDKALTSFRSAMDRRGNPADAVADLSRAHLTALEAQAYFREIEFLTRTEGEEALLKFKGFLRRPSLPPPAGPVLVLGLLLGALFGALYIWVTYVPKPEVVEPATPLAIAQYPWALKLLFFGGLAYAGAGMAMNIIGGLFSAGAAAKAREEALDALRGAFTAREAPRPADVVRRIEDAVDVFRARVGGRGNMSTNSNHAAQHSAPDDGIPEWRRRDSSAKFVETGFQAAPERWRTDAYSKKLEGDALSKRERPGFKKPSQN